mgnify:CR=1 FL=1
MNGSRGPSWAWLAVGAIGLVGALGGALWQFRWKEVDTHLREQRDQITLIADHEVRIRVLENNQHAILRIEQKLDRVLAHDTIP